jgi:hypothetical protein
MTQIPGFDLLLNSRSEVVIACAVRTGKCINMSLFRPAAEIPSDSDSDSSSFGACLVLSFLGLWDPFFAACRGVDDADSWV